MEPIWAIIWNRMASTHSVAIFYRLVTVNLRLKEIQEFVMRHGIVCFDMPKFLMCLRHDDCKQKTRNEMISFTKERGRI